MTEEKEKLIREDYSPWIEWKSSGGTKKHIRDMDYNHIINTIKCLLGIGGTAIPNPYYGKSKDEWLIIFDQCLRNRNLSNAYYSLYPSNNQLYEIY